MPSCFRLRRSALRIERSSDSTMSSMESRADRLMRTAISTLFRTEADIRQVIKLKAIYELLETITDKCEDVANVVEGIILEHH